MITDKNITYIDNNNSIKQLFSDHLCRQKEGVHIDFDLESFFLHIKCFKIFMDNYFDFLHFSLFKPSNNIDNENQQL